MGEKDKWIRKQNSHLQNSHGDATRSPGGMLVVLQALRGVPAASQPRRGAPLVGYRGA